MSSSDNRVITLTRSANDPIGNPEEAGQEWINYDTQKEWYARRNASGDLEWVEKTIQLTPEQFRMLEESVDPLATETLMREGTSRVRRGMSPYLISVAIAALTRIANGSITAEKLAQALRDTIAGKINSDDFASIAENTFAPGSPTSTQETSIDFASKIFGIGKVNVAETPHALDGDSNPVPKAIQIDLQNTVAKGIYFLEIVKPSNVADELRIRLDESTIVTVSFNGAESHLFAPLTQATGIIRVAIVVDNFNPGTARGLLLSQEISNQRILDVLNNTQDAENLDDRDKFLVEQPLDEARPHNSNLQTFSSQSTPPITVAAGDFLSRVYDTRTGIGDPNETVFFLATSGILNFFSPQFQMEQVDAEAVGDIPNTPRKSLVLTDFNGNRHEGVLIINPREGKIVLLIDRGELNLEFHFGTARRISTSFSPIPAMGNPGRIPIGLIKRRGQTTYNEVGGYIWDILAPDIPTVWPTTAQVTGMALKITALATSRPGVNHLSLFLADLSYMAVQVGQNLKALPFQPLLDKWNELLNAKTQGVVNRLEPKIDANTEAISELRGETVPFDMTVFGTSLSLTDSNSIPAVNVEFDITFYVQGVDRAPSGNFTAFIDGSPIEVTEQPVLRERVNGLVVRIPNETTRMNIIRQAERNRRLDIQIVKGGERSNIAHVPLHNPQEPDRYSEIPEVNMNIGENETVTLATFTGLNIGRHYTATIDVAVSDHDSNDRLRILLSRTQSSAEAVQNKIYREDYGRIGNNSEQTFTFDFIAKATTLFILGNRTAGGDATLSVTANGIVIESTRPITKIAGTDFSA